MAMLGYVSDVVIFQCIYTCFEKEISRSNFKSLFYFDIPVTEKRSTQF